MTLTRPLWVLSLFLFLGGNLFVYGDLGSTVNIYENSTQILASLPKTQFFYTAFSVMLILNILLLLGSYTLPYLPPAMILAPQKDKWTATPISRKHFYKKFKLWTKGLGLFMNLFLTGCVFAIYYMNSRNTFPLNWFFYLIGILSLLWIIGYPVLMKYNEDEF